MAAVSVKCLCFWPLLWFCIRLSETINTRFSLDDDVLLPYTHSHGPSHSHRHVRDCQPLIHGNTTHESQPSSNSSGLPEAESKIFVIDVPGTSRWVYGHMTVVRDPLRTFSVLEPGGPGGCGMNRRSTVQDTAQDSGCLYAQNAGFFKTGTGQCLGNVVSDGRLVQDSSGVQNAQFGIRRDGTLVFGYLSQEDVLDQSNPFVQLVSGVVWLLRKGEVYINESLKAECDKTQETGRFQRFVDVVSARTAVGHDAEGNLVLYQNDGKTDERGMNLWQLAEFLKKNGVINAINLDGGGSSTYVIDGSLASYPSDQCSPSPPPAWRCGRNVSTILCVRRRHCRPANCSGNGDCVDGSCQCLPGFYGDGCNQTCTCMNGGSCDPVHGRCTCPPGFYGNTCDRVCPLGVFGLSCAQKCLCDDQCLCDPQTGSCNATLHEETNASVHTAGRCLAKQMFTSWRREEESHREQPHLTELTWLIITLTLAFLLSASLLVHVVRCCPGSAAAHFPHRQDYTYVPLTDINGAASRTGANAGTSGNRDFGLDDSDSQDEAWSPPRSGRS